LNVAAITFTTDFGCHDWFVGTMKGVVLGINPQARMVDITHEIPAGDIRAGAFALAASYRFFPKDTVHLAVVDPGVGTDRKAIVVRTASYCFVGPDNGLLSWALRGQRILSVHFIENSAFFRTPVSHTFHGRDVFAPVAAHLSHGVSPGRFGPPTKTFTQLDWPEPRRRGGKVEGKVVYVDRFGNAITNIDATALASLSGAEVVVTCGRKRLCGLAASYAAVGKMAPVAIVGSSGFLEIAVNRGNAAQRLGLAVGSPVTLSRAGYAEQSATRCTPAGRLKYR
jgi:hypothetical protein